MMRLFVHKCTRCKTWEVCFIAKDEEEGDYIDSYIDGFKSWREAFDYALEYVTTNP